MTKNETELTAGRANVTNNNVRPPSGAKRLSYRLRILSAALAVLFSVGAWSQTQLATRFRHHHGPKRRCCPRRQRYDCQPRHWVETEHSLQTRQASTVSPACQQEPTPFA